MAITLAAAPDVRNIAISMESTTGDKAIKRTPVGSTASDANVIAALTALDNVSNARFFGNFGGRLISGQKGSAVNAGQNLISAFMSLNFSQTDPINPANTVQRSFTVPAYVDELDPGTHIPDVGTPGTGSVSAYLGTLVVFLEDHLAFEAADGSIVEGGFTYVGGGFGTGNDVVDGI